MQRLFAVAGVLFFLQALVIMYFFAADLRPQPNNPMSPTAFEVHVSQLAMMSYTNRLMGSLFACCAAFWFVLLFRIRDVDQKTERSIVSQSENRGGS